MAGPEAWLAGLEPWLSGPDAWLTRPGAQLARPEAWLAGHPASQENLLILYGFVPYRDRCPKTMIKTVFEKGHLWPPDFCTIQHIEKISNFPVMNQEYDFNQLLCSGMGKGIKDVI